MLEDNIININYWQAPTSEVKMNVGESHNLLATEPDITLHFILPDVKESAGNFLYIQRGINCLANLLILKIDDKSNILIDLTKEIYKIKLISDGNGWEIEQNQ